MLGWGEIAKNLVGPAMVLSVGKGVDEGLELSDAAGQIVGGAELVSPGRLGALDAALEIGSLGRQDDGFEAAAPFLIT